MIKNTQTLSLKGLPMIKNAKSLSLRRFLINTLHPLPHCGCFSTLSPEPYGYQLQIECSSIKCRKSIGMAPDFDI
jgi:hypothetical protein